MFSQPTIEENRNEEMPQGWTEDLRVAGEKCYDNKAERDEQRGDSL